MIRPILLVLVIFSLNASAFAPFTLNCKGGPSMLLKVMKSVMDDNQISYILEFKKASAGTNQRPLAYGECAWPHRALNNKEKAVLTIDEPIRGGFVYQMKGNKQSIELLEYGRENYSSRQIRYFNLIMKAIKERNNFSVVAPLGRYGVLYIDKVLVNQ